MSQIPSNFKFTACTRKYLESHMWDFKNPIIDGMTTLFIYKDFKCIKCGMMLWQINVETIKYFYDLQENISCNEFMMKSIIE